MSLPRAALAFAVLSAPAWVGGCRTVKPDRVGGGPIGAAGPAGPPSPRTEVELPNGVRIIVEENHVTPMVAIQVWVAAGSADDAPELSGAAHIYEHLVLRGGKRRAPGAGAREIEAVGGSLGAWTGLDETVYYTVVAAPFLDLGTDVLADALAAPRFDADEVERARRQALDEIAGSEADSARRAADTLFATAFAGHGYGRPVLGTAASVRGLSSSALAARYAQGHVGPAMTVVVVGDVDARGVEAVKRAFGAIPKGSGKRSTARGEVGDAGGSGRLTVAAAGTRAAQILLGFRTPQLDAEDAAALDLWAALLARGDVARIPRELVRNRRLAEGTRAFTFNSVDGGLAAIAVTPAPHRVAEAAEAVVELTARFVHEPPSEDELIRARAAVEADLARGEEGALGRARRLGFAAVIAGDVDFISRYRERLATVSAAELQAAAEKFLVPGALTLAVIVPEGAAARAPAPATLKPRLEAALARAASGAAPAAPNRAPVAVRTAGGEVVRHVGRSGARLLVLRDPGAPLVSVEAAWPVRSEGGGGEAEAASALVATLLDRGTRTRSAAEVRAHLRVLAGAAAGFFGAGTLGLRAEFLGRELEQGLAIVGDCLLFPTFPDEELDPERRALAARLAAAARGTGPGADAALRLFRETLWPDRVRRPEPEAVGGLTRVRLLDFYRRNFPVGRLVMAVVGDVDPARVIAAFDAALAGAPQGATPAPAPAAVASAPPPPAAPPAATAPAAAAAPVPNPASPPQVEPTTVFRKSAAGDSEVVVGYPTLAPGDPDRLPLEVLAEILTGAEGRLIDDKSFSCRVSGRAAEPVDPGYLAVALSCAPARVDAAVASVRAAFARVLATGVTADEVTRAARRLIGARAAALRTRNAVAAALARDEAYGLPLLAERGRQSALARIGAEDVGRAARRALDPRREVIAVVGGGER